MNRYMLLRNTFKTHNHKFHFPSPLPLFTRVLDDRSPRDLNKHDLPSKIYTSSFHDAFLSPPFDRAANFSNTDSLASKLRFGTRWKCETVGQTAENVYIRGKEREREGGMSTIYVRGGDKTPCTSSSIMLSFSVRFLSRFSLGISRGEGENLSNSPWERRLKSRGAVRFLG